MPADRHNNDNSRRSFLKKFSIASSTALAGGLAGCIGGDDDSDGNSGNGGDGGNDNDLSSLLTITGLENSYWESVVKGHEEATDVFAYDDQLELNDGNLDNQFSQVDTGIANGVDAIIGQAFENAGVQTLAQAAVDAGVPQVQFWSMATWLTPPDVGDEWIQFHMPNSFLNGYANAVVLFEAMGGSGGFAHIEGNRGVAPNRGRNNGLEAAMEEYPDIERLNDPIPGNWLRNDSRDAMSDIYSSHGDDIEGFFGQNDAATLGGLTILEENDLDVPAVGIDGSEPALQAVQEGRMTATISALGPWQAGWSLAKCYDYLNGWRPEPAERMVMHPGVQIVNDPSEYDDVDQGEIEMSTPETFMELIYEGDTPYDWEKMSVVENPDSWDPQVPVVPITPQLQEDVLGWTEDNRPDGYELPEAYTGGEEQEEVRQMYEDHYQNDPLA